jgi:hypothetical protein
MRYRLSALGVLVLSFLPRVVSAQETIGGDGTTGQDFYDAATECDGFSAIFSARCLWFWIVNFLQTLYNGLVELLKQLVQWFFEQVQSLYELIAPYICPAVDAITGLVEVIIGYVPGLSPYTSLVADFVPVDVVSIAIGVWLLTAGGAIIYKEIREWIPFV